MSFKLSRAQRIRHANAFRAVFKNGRLLKGRRINLWVYRDTQNGERKELPRLGVIVSRKAARTAVKRNLWKRRIREVFRKNQQQLSLNLLLLIQVKAGASLRSEEIREELTTLWEKAKIIK